MPSLRSLRDALRARIIEHFELLLTAVGVSLAVSLTFAQIDRGTQAVALAFLVWLQGVLIWAVRRHSRLGQARLVRKLRLMLQDRVNNHLTVLVGVAELRRVGSTPTEHDDVATAVTAARAVSEALAGLSLESLRHWEARHARHLPVRLQ